MSQAGLIFLLEKFINDSATADELKQLRDCLAEQQNSLYAREWIEMVLRENSYGSHTDFDLQIMFDEILLKSTTFIDKQPEMAEEIDIVHSSPVVTLYPEKTAHRFIKKWGRYAAAIILLAIAGTYFFWSKPSKEIPVTAEINPVPVQQDITPGGNKALLTLSDGSTIVLDSAAIGTLASQGTSTIQKTANGEIIYSAGVATASQAISYNTMSTPRGGQYTLTLPDGSRVWLNAASSITYPTLFTGHERTVSITGEAYFEVAKNKEMPFVVNVASEQITVLGTAFNVNAYADNRPVKTSLLEGSVKVGNKTLQPGEAYYNGQIIKTDVAQDIAWKNGVFNFHGMALKEVMSQLERWYNIEVIYDGPIPKMQFFGEMGRDLTLSQVLKGLEGSGVNFSIEKGNRIIVK